MTKQYLCVTNVQFIAPMVVYHHGKTFGRVLCWTSSVENSIALLGKRFHKVLPLSNLQQYTHLLEVVVDDPSIFEDFTIKLVEYKILESEKEIGVQKAHNKFCFPKVRCPFGCTEFVGETGTILFQYLLNKMDMKFTYKDTKWKSRLNSPRPDWLQEYNHSDFFTVVTCNCR